MSDEAPRSTRAWHPTLDLPEYTQVFVTLLAMTNPVGKIPVFNALADIAFRAVAWRSAAGAIRPVTRGLAHRPRGLRVSP